ncbi:unnamed protein product [Mytilus coruscus]|uniref:Uncharacterized protein n=1 Tax=Mytilus coruscus TaxID=42192 RepID=A0A6J8EQF9_MYTCO|nr:unnamed protein product [Mytilus coruscus]
MTKQTNDPTGMNYTPGASRSTMDERYSSRDTSVTEDERYKPIASRGIEEQYKPTASQRTAEERLQPIEWKSGPIKKLTEEEGSQGTVNVSLKSEVKQDRLLKRQKDVEQERSVIPNEQDSIQHTYPSYDVIHQKVVDKMESVVKQKQTVDNCPGTVVDGFQKIDSLVTNENSIKPTENKRTVDKIYKQTDTPVTMDDMYTSTDRPVTSKRERISSEGSSMSDKKHKPEDIPFKKEHIPKPTFTNSPTVDQYKPVNSHITTEPKSVLSQKNKNKDCTLKEQNKYKPTESTVTNNQVTVRKSIIPEDIRYHENTENIKDERLESYSPSSDDTEKFVERHQNGDGIFLLTTPEEDSDENFSFTELEKTIYSKKASPRRKSIADELEQYFTDHPESPMLSSTLLSLPKTPGMQRPQYLNTLKKEHAIEDRTANNETDTKRITQEEFYFESTSHED